MMELILKSLIQGVIYALIAMSVIWFAHGPMHAGKASSFPPIPADTWQAVFLTGGQVYFGKLSDVGDGYVSLSNVYYLKSANELEQSNLNLVKLGGELHGPEDTIYIRKESISFWENMKDTSRVVQTIQGARQ
jgi:hypothetical protein